MIRLALITVTRNRKGKPVRASRTIDGESFAVGRGTQCAVYLPDPRVALEHAKIAVVETDLERRIRWIYNTRLDVRDREVVGKTASEIGEALGISEWTAVYHLDRIKKRFGLSKRHQMVIRAMSLGLIAA